MNLFNSHTFISIFRSLVYLFALVICLVTIFSSSEKVNEDSIRIMTYNIHHGEGMDGVVDLQRIADVINKENPDILLLQEVDVNLKRSGARDFPGIFSEMTGLEHVQFGKNLDIDGGSYGNATLSVFPITSSRNFQFEQIGPEQRGVLATEISVNGRNLLVLNTHLDHSEGDSERLLYSEKTMSDILPQYNADAVLFGGDFNDIPISSMYRQLNKEFGDAWVVSGQGNELTSPADQPSKRIDYIFFKNEIKPVSTWVPVTEASDHLPVVADFIWVDEE